MKSKQVVKKSAKTLPASPAKRQVRKYDNSGRAEKSANTQKKIIETLVALLVQKKGAEVQMAEVAESSGIAERTIFRFFKDKKTLLEAMDTYLLEYLNASAAQMRDLDFLGFAVNAYALFDKHESLTMAYLFSPFGHEARAIFRKKLSQAMTAKISQEYGIKMNAERMKRLALVTSLVNAKIWYDIRADYGFTGEEMGPSVEWALKTLIKNC